ncbi:MAG: N-acetylmuramoyl-L-alanine amidase [Syntrophomonadaceae bacterium]|jgi:N-acetylmuramoyl-L-alanine amidase
MYSDLARRTAVFKIALLLFIATAVFLIWQSPALAASGTITGSVVNVRSGPSTDHTVTGNLLQGTEVTVLEEQNGWYHISYNNLNGWVSAQYIKVTPGATVQVTGSLVNLRSGPGTSHAVVGQARQGDTLLLLGKEGDWCKVQTASGLICYVSSSLVQNGTAAQAGTATPQTKATTTSTADGQDIKVYLDGELLSFDVPPRIEQGRTLVPLRAIFEAMGATVDWDQSSQIVTATRQEVIVQLPIGSKSPTVNGIVWPLDVPAKIVGDRTLAPLRFVGEAFGGKVEWNEAERTIHIESPEPPSTPAVATPSSNKLVVVQGSTVNLREGPGTGYDKVGLASAGETLPVLAEKDGWFQVSRGGTPAWIAGWLVCMSDDSPNSPAVSDDELVWYSTSKDKDGLRINIESGSRLGAHVDNKSGKMVYTIMGRSLKGNTPLNVNLGGKSIVVSGENRNGDAVITVTIPAGLEYRTEKSSDGRRESVVFDNRIVQISRKVFGNIGDNIIVYTLTPCEFSYSLKNDILEVRLKSTYKGVERSSYDYQVSPFLEKMTIQESSSSPPDTILRIETKNLGDYSIFQTSDDNALNIILTGSKRSDDKNNKLVVLDPGHGGRDTGANGARLQEKEVNLDIALQAGEILAQRGFEVAYTRDDDTYLTLSERCQIANELNAAVFVSVHCNSAENSSATGTETYYYASLEDPERFMQKEQRYKLARLLQQNLVRQLGLADRGVKQDRFTVIMDTNMPSALVETAFINNPSEEACLMDKSFRSKAARAIADAITEYMNKR